MQHQRKIVDDYVKAFVTLTPDNAEDLYGLVADDVFFSDPFNVIHDKDGFRRIFDHMFETCISPGFTVNDIAHSDAASYLRWKMTGKLKSWPHTNLLFEGMTEVHVNSQGLVCRHIDHWDSASQLMRDLPIIGLIIKPILKLFQLKPTKK
jgi:steroid delta-isomerase